MEEPAEGLQDEVTSELQPLPAPAQIFNQPSSEAPSTSTRKGRRYGHETAKTSTTGAVLISNDYAPCVIFLKWCNFGHIFAGVKLNFDVSKIRLPNKKWAVVEQSENNYNIVKIKDTSSLRGIVVSHAIRLQYNRAEVELNGKLQEDLHLIVTSSTSLEGLVQKIDGLKTCEGPGFGRHATQCPGWVPGKAERCFHCKGLRAAMKKRMKRRTALKEKHHSPKMKQKLQNLKRSRQRIYSKVICCNFCTASSEGKWKKKALH